MKKLCVFVSVFLILILSACSKQTNNAPSAESEQRSTTPAQSEQIAQAEQSEEQPEQSSAESNMDSSASQTAPSGAFTSTVCVATPDNFVHGETVTISAIGDHVTHMQIVTEVDITSEVQMQSYNFWTPSYKAHYAGTAVSFTANESAGTWTYDFDLNDDTADILSEYYVDFSLIAHSGTHYSKDRMIVYYEALQYTCTEQ